MQADIEAESEPTAGDEDEDDDEGSPHRKSADRGRQLEGSMKAVKGLCSTLDRRVGVT